MAESSTPPNFSGGNVIGTRRTLLKIPNLPRIVQNASLRRPAAMAGRPKGIRYLPILSVRAGAATLAELNSGISDFRLGTRKSYMRCLPGLQPVWNEDHATGESAGSVVLKRAKAPRSRKREKFGSSP